MRPTGTALRAVPVNCRVNDAPPIAEGFLGGTDLRRDRRRLHRAGAGIPPRHHASHGAGHVSDPGGRAACGARRGHRAAFVAGRWRAGCRGSTRGRSVSPSPPSSCSGSRCNGSGSSPRLPRWCWSAPMPRVTCARWRISALAAVMVLFSVAVFVWLLGLPLPLWPRCLRRAMEIVVQSRSSASASRSAGRTHLLLDRLHSRHPGRRAARNRSGGDGGHAAALHLRARSGACPDHARRHLLRRSVRRLDDGHSGQHSGRIVLRGHDPRRSSDGAPWPRRARARHCRDRFVRGRLHRNARRCVLRSRRSPSWRSSSVQPTISR